jgi:hypothetical protein
MNILIDILGSVVIAGILMIAIFNANTYQSQARFTSDSELQLQQNAKTLADIINYDLRKIGYEYENVPFIEADSERISFYTDIDLNGSIDIVTYFLSDTSAAKGTNNPNDRILIRVANTDTLKGPSLGLRKVKFSYLNKFYTPSTTFEEIRYVKAELWIESIEEVDDEYLFTYWEMTINPRNL